MQPSRARRSGAAVAALTLGLALGACSSTSSSGSGTSVSGTSVSGTSVSGTSVALVDGVRHLDVAGFARLAAAPSTVLLDVRTPQEFTAGHLPGARNLDIGASTFDAQLGALDKAVTYAVYCHSGNRSNQALQRMATAGFTHVADLSGGITAWTAAGQQTTTN